MTPEVVTTTLDAPAPLRVGNLEIDPTEFTATYSGEALRLTNKEFRLLALFARHPGRLLTRDAIATEVWDGEVRGRTIDIHIARLRRRLPPDAIETVIKVGYRLSPAI